ncbi:MAG TPA: PAS domain S-box protein [Chitinophagaceae bacterium]|nr:PAS domain S-box protein [Chitinophagaceae bacterium]
MPDYKEKYESLVRLASDGCIIYDPGGKILEFNEGACRHLGYTPEEFKHLALFDLFLEEDLRKRPLRFDLMKNGDTALDYRKIKRKNGEAYLIELNSLMLPDGNIMALATDVTENAKIRKELRMKEHAIASSISGMGITDLEGKIIYVNRALCDMWGALSEPDLMGRNVQEMFEGTQVFDILPGLQDKAIEYGECTGKRLNGTIFPVAYSANIVPDKNNNPAYIFGSFLDLSEQKKTRYLSDSIIDNLPVIFFMYDVPSGTIRRWNTRMEELTGYTRAEISDMKYFELVYEQDRELAARKLLETVQLGKCDAEISLVDKQGKLHPFYFTGFLVKLGDKEVVIANGIDISERKLSEEKLQRKYDQLQLIANLSDAVSKANQLDDIYKLALDGLLTTIQADRASVLQFDEEGVMQFKAAHGLSEHYRLNAAGHSPWKQDAINPIPIFVTDVSEEPSLSGLLPVIQNEGITALGFIPLVYMNHLLGKFMVYFNKAHQFTEEESQLLQTIAREVAFAIGEKRNEIALRKSEQQYRELSAHLQDIREEERSAIAREIHDELGQQLTVLKIDFSWLESRLNIADNRVLTDKFSDISNLLDRAVNTVRRMSTSLRPSMLDDLGLVATIDWYLADFGRRVNLKTEFHHEDEEYSMPDKMRTAFFRIFQESITNVIRHSDATTVLVELSRLGGHISLKITDNGKGFDMSTVSGKRTLGLLGMRERSLLIGGECRIESIPGRGTTVSVEVNPN